VRAVRTTPHPRGTQAFFARDLGGDATVVAQPRFPRYAEASKMRRTWKSQDLFQPSASFGTCCRGLKNRCGVRGRIARSAAVGIPHHVRRGVQGKRYRFADATRMIVRARRRVIHLRKASEFCLE